MTSFAKPPAHTVDFLNQTSLTKMTAALFSPRAFEDTGAV
jgi:hypothetical protein